MFTTTTHIHSTLQHRIGHRAIFENLERYQSALYNSPIHFTRLNSKILRIKIRVSKSSKKKSLSFHKTHKGKNYIEAIFILLQHCKARAKKKQWISINQLPSNIENSWINCDRKDKVFGIIENLYDVQYEKLFRNVNIEKKKCPLWGFFFGVCVSFVRM